MGTQQQPKEKPDLLSVMSLHGVDTTAVQGRTKGTLRCPFHEDNGRPNMSVRVDTQIWHCFRCGIGGDVYDFVGFTMYKNDWDKRNREMFRAVAEALKAGNIPKAEIREVQAPKPISRQMMDVMGLAARVYQTSLQGKSGEEARQYLEQRRISTEIARQLRIGFAIPGVLASVLATFPPATRQIAEEIGLIQDGREWLCGRITFPDITLGGQVQYLAGRSLQPDAKLRYLGLPIRKTMFLLGRANKSLPVIVTESVIDTVNLVQMQFQGVGVNGTGMQPHWAQELNKFPVVCFAQQNDDAGREAVERWQTLIPHGRVVKIPDKYKDLNDAVKDVGIAEAKKLVLQGLEQVNIHVL